jgi:hypothetical protein
MRYCTSGRISRWYLTPRAVTSWNHSGGCPASARCGRRATSDPPQCVSLDYGRLSASAWPALAFGAHRFRAFRQAQRAFEQERAELGDRFQQDGIEEFATEAVLAGEMAAMLAV